MIHIVGSCLLENLCIVFYGLTVEVWWLYSFWFCCLYREEHGHHDHESYYGERDTDSLVAVRLISSLYPLKFYDKNTLLRLFLKTCLFDFTVHDGASSSTSCGSEICNRRQVWQHRSYQFNYQKTCSALWRLQDWGLCESEEGTKQLPSKRKAVAVCRQWVL